MSQYLNSGTLASLIETPAFAEPDGPDVSVVMPCLNEEQTIGTCVDKALHAIEQMGLTGEVVVSDNGSLDRSVEIARAHGARVVHEPVQGYGSAYLKGLGEARGRYIVMGDSDDTYDFSQLARFVAPLQDGYDMVVGNRFKGEILPGAMPWHHRHIGNPVLSGILNLLFRSGIGDAHCGLRSLRGDMLEQLHLQTTGMEFASEMVINASLAGLRLAEVPVTYYPRDAGAESKLQSWRDGWRHLRFMLLYGPNWLYMVPGFSLLGFGFFLLLSQFFGPIDIGPVHLNIHFMVLGSLCSLLGFQLVSLGIYAKVYSLTGHFQEHNAFIEWLLRRFNLERGTILGLAIFLTGLGINVAILYRWVTVGFGGQPRLREAILAMTLMVIGAQVIFSSFYLSMLGIKRTGTS